MSRILSLFVVRVVAVLLLALFLIAAVLPAAFSPTAEIIVTALVAVLLGAIGVKPMDWLKHKFGLEGSAARWLIFVISFIVAVIVLFLAGDLAGIIAAGVTPENVGAIAGLFFMAATDVYQRLNPTPQT